MFDRVRLTIVPSQTQLIQSSVLAQFYL